MSLFTDKKALSEIVSYVMLIVIAISLSVIVFAYLKVYIPKEKPQCPEDISLIIQKASCSISTYSNLNITLENKGLFNIDSAYIRFGLQEKKVLDLIESPLNNFFFINPSNSSERFLPPQKQTEWYALFEPSYASTLSTGGYALEVQPVVYVDKKLIICEKAIVRQNVECK